MARYAREQGRRVVGVRRRGDEREERLAEVVEYAPRAAQGGSVVEGRTSVGWR